MIAIASSYVIMYYARFGQSYLVESPEFIFFILKASLLYAAVNALLGIYSINRTKNPDHVLLSLTIWFGLTVSYFFFRKKLFFSRFVLISGMWLAFLFIKLGRVGLRIIHRKLLKYGVGVTNVLFIGCDQNTDRIAASLKRQHTSKLIGYVGEKQSSNTLAHRGVINDYKKIIREHDVEEVIQVSENVSQSEEILEYCLQNRVQYRFVPSLVALHSTNIDTETIGGMPVISLKPTPLDGWGRVVKRAVDIMGSLLGIILLSPLMTAIALGVKISSRGPSLVALERINQGKKFKIYKFRSMIVGAHAMKDQLIKEGRNQRGDGPLFKMEQDPRVTGFGQFIRNTRLDELPQLFNVLKGEMSLVGPRPHETKEVAMYKDHHLKTLAIKPGMTGISQISGNSDLTFEQEVRLDLYYIENWSILWDLKIIVKTIIFVCNPDKKNV